MNACGGTALGILALGLVLTCIGGASAGDAAGVQLKQTDDAIEISIDGKPFTTYLFAPKPSMNQRVLRPCFYPVLGLNQVPMTRNYPLAEGDPKETRADHPHHTSLWVAYGSVNGVDNWANATKSGWQIHKTFEAVESGAEAGMFRETLDWTDAEKKPVMAEVRTVRIPRPKDDTVRILDLEIALQAKYGKVVFGDTKEGGLCSTRMRTELRADKDGKSGRLVNSNGETAGASWGKRALWVDASGEVEGKRYGFAIFDHPANLRHPVYWHSRTYGLLTTNPFAIQSFDKKNPEKGGYTLDEGKDLTLRYRVLFHLGDEKEGRVAERYAEYAGQAKPAEK
ncbi:MAG TPA: PmoA family protein [Planctomycetota bacterium]|nr:PmoA family protein [Planctomycetota bacterium]